MKKIFDIDTLRDRELDAINISAIKRWYNVIKWFLIGATVLLEFLILMLLVINLRGSGGADHIDIAILIRYVIMFFATPFFTCVAWICIKPLIGLTYDVKLLKYITFAENTLIDEESNKNAELNVESFFDFDQNIQ